MTDHLAHTAATTLAMSCPTAVPRGPDRRLLIKHRYPPDKQPEAIRLVIAQMEVIAPRVAA